MCPLQKEKEMKPLKQTEVAQILGVRPVTALRAFERRDIKSVTLNGNRGVPEPEIQRITTAEEKESN